MNLNNTLHLIAQPQSGIGKSYIVFLLRQYLEAKAKINFYSIQETNIQLWDKIFDKFFIRAQQNFLIDVDSAAYEPFKKYIAETNLLNSISDFENKVIYHNIFTPGQNGEKFIETLNYISG